MKDQIKKVIEGLKLGPEKEKKALEGLTELFSLMDEQDWKPGGAKKGTVMGGIAAYLVGDRDSNVAEAVGMAESTIKRYKGYIGNFYWQASREKAKEDERRAELEMRSYPLFDEQERVCAQIVKTLSFFFDSRKFAPPVPFRGFMLAGAAGQRQN